MLDVTWQPAGIEVSLDTSAPRIEQMCLIDRRLVIDFSEAIDATKLGQQLVVNGSATTWNVDSTGLSAELSVQLSPGEHTLSLGTGPLDLADQGLAELPEVSTITVSTASQSLYSAPFAGETTTSAVGNAFGFHGLHHDDETRLVYARHRYLDPELGRFTSVDPYGYADGPSMYQFALNNPVSYSDPTGEFASALVDVGFALYDTVQLISGNIGSGEYAARMALTGAALLADAATGGTGGGLAVRAAVMGGRTGRAARRTLQAAVVVNRGEMAVSAGQAAFSAQDALSHGQWGRVGLSAVQAVLSMYGVRAGNPNFINEELLKSGRFFRTGTLPIQNTDRSDPLINELAEELEIYHFGNRVISSEKLIEIGRDQILTIVAHGSADTIAGHSRAKLGKFLRASGFRAGGIELISCGTACGSAAQDLSDTLDVPIRAFQGAGTVRQGVPRVWNSARTQLLSPGERVQVLVPRSR